MKKSHRYVDVVAICLIGVIALYFRTYLYCPWFPKSPGLVAKTLVYEKIKEQYKKRLDGEFFGVDDKTKWVIANQRAEEAIQLDKSKYEQTVLSVEQNIQKQGAKLPGYSRPYLLEADPYYYYYLTQQIQKKGTISPKFKDGKFYTSLREAPKGAWTTLTWHPYAGYGWHCLFTLFNPQADLMESLCYYPLVIVILVVIAYFFLCYSIQASRLGTWGGAFALTLAPVFIERSTFGWYDTDAYQYLFPCIIFGLFFLGIRHTRVSFYCAIASGFMTGLYSLFWAGWPFILIPILGAGFMAGFLNRFWKERVLESFFSQTIIFFLSSILCALVFMTPSGFYYVISNGVLSIQKYARVDYNLWPNAFLTVGEAMPTTIKKLVYLCSNLVNVSVATIGFSLMPLVYLWKREILKFCHWFVFAMLFFVSLMLALNTERFSVLLALPISFFVLKGCEFIEGLLHTVLNFLSKGNMPLRTIRGLCVCVVLGLILPQTFIFAQATAMNKNTLIMNDAWYQALLEMKERTPEDAVVDSWWPPGYFIISVANRKVVIDGGTQQLPQTYWMAKMLVSSDEKQALGLLRMLHSSGNDAMDYLLSKGLDLSEAQQLILKIVSFGRDEAERLLPSQLSNTDKIHLLNLTHGTKSLLPAYLFLYNDLIDQNLAVSLIANWDFERAKKIQSARSQSTQQRIHWPGLAAAHLKDIKGFTKSMVFKSAEETNRLISDLKTQKMEKMPQRFQNYVNEVVSIVGDIWKYTPEAEATKQEGDLVTFGNGLCVNLRTLEATVPFRDERRRWNPISLFYVSDGLLKEKMFSGNIVDMSALLIKRRGSYTSVLANPGLIRSILFRLYYLKGEEMKWFKPFILKDDAATRTSIYVFQVNWEGLQS